MNCSRLRPACIGEDIDVAIHSNFHTEGQSDIYGFKLFAALVQKPDKTLDDTKDLPAFLKSNK